MKLELNKDAKFVTKCDTCGDYWNSQTKGQAILLKSVHLTNNESHDVWIKELT